MFVKSFELYCHICNRWFTHASSCCYSCEYMDGELDKNKVRRSSTHLGVSEKAQRSQESLTLASFLLFSLLPPSLLPAFIPSFFLFLGKGSVNRKWEELRQIGWPLVGARARSDLRLWEEPRTHPSSRWRGSNHKSNTGNHMQNPCTKGEARLESKGRIQRPEITNGGRG